MTKWKTQLENFDSMLKELRQKREERDGRLRFDRSAVSVSDIAEQYYCEKKLEIFPSEPEKKPQEKSKQIVISGICSVTKYDEMTLNVEFELIPSKAAFSKVISSLWFDEHKVKSAIISIPQRFGVSSDFELKSELDMRGISAGTHTIGVELRDCFSPSYATKKERIEYIPQDRKAIYRKIPIAKKIAGCDFAVISDSEKKVYREIEKTKKKELISRQDKW